MKTKALHKISRANKMASFGLCIMTSRFSWRNDSKQSITGSTVDNWCVFHLAPFPPGMRTAYNAKVVSCAMLTWRLHPSITYNVIEIIPSHFF